MGKRILLTISFLYLFFTHHFLVAQSICALPAPQDVQFTDVTPNSIFLNWSPVTGAVSYRITIYDETNQVALPDVYSTVPNVELEELEPATTNYEIGISSSSCVSGPYGPPVYIQYKPGIIIIVDVVIEASAPNLGDPVVHPASNPETIEIPMNANSSGNIEVKHIKIRYGNSPNDPTVEFLVWSDCYEQTRFHEIAATGAYKLAHSEESIHYKLTNGNNFFILNNGDCELNFCTASIDYVNTSICRVSSNVWELKNDKNTCGSGGSRTGGEENLLVQQVTVHPAATAHTRSNTATSAPAFQVSMPPTETPESTTLQAIPNPFNDHIRVRYDIETPQTVSISLMNPTGTTVQDLLPLQWTERGSYTIDRSLSEKLPSGVYFLVMRTGSDLQVVRLIKE